ncbi:MAG TPA: RDD family protein [Gemmatimonadaceae bacterium]|jgi:uncharacterized RDD family membrane protein YckC
MQPFASRANRLLGQIADGFVGAAPLLVGVMLSRISHALGSVLILVGVPWAVFYYFFADGFPAGQSLGKRWLGMHAVDAVTGAPCTFWQSFIRNLLLALLGPIDWIFIFGERHQRLGDMAAGTIVVAD